MSVLTNIGITVAAFIMMEGVAWFTHKYVMHGLLWILHRDHHQPHEGFFERNDFFFLLFAAPGIALMLTGMHDFGPQFFVGLGIALYGFAYFTVHDIFIHQRFKILRRTNNIYFRAIRKAHKVHHKHMGKEDGECFGMLFVPWKYFREAMRAA